MTTQPGVELVPYEVNGISTALVDGKLTDQQRNYFEEQWKDCPRADIELFFWTADKYHLNPFGVAQIYGVPRKQNGVRRLVTQVGINGLTLIAQRTGEFGGVGLPEWCGDDGVWRSFWNFTDARGNPKPPAACKISVTRFTRYGAGLSWGIAMWNESADIYEGKPQNLWRSKPAHMLAKTATATAIRRAFQQEFAELRAEFAPELGERRQRARATIQELYDAGGQDIDAPAEPAALPEASEPNTIDATAQPAPEPAARKQTAAAPNLARQVGNQGDPSAFWALARSLGYKGQDVAPAVFGVPTMLAWLHGDPALTWDDALRMLQEASAQADPGPDPTPSAPDDAPLTQQAALAGMNTPVERRASERGA